MLRFGTDGVRGVALTELSTQYVASLGAAAAVALGSGIWLIGQDTRDSSPTLASAFAAGLQANGATVESCGMLPTPALAFLSMVRGLPAAMITASHNPYTDNGVKIFAAGGLKLSDAVEATIEALIVAGGDPQLVPLRDVPSSTTTYVEHLVSMFPARALVGVHVVLDCANGAMSVVAPLVVAALGATVTVLHATPNGVNINAQCGATHPGSLAAAVVDHGADLGLAFDGDGDRLIAVDERGNVVDGDRLIGLGAVHLRDQGLLRGNTVVVTQMSNLGFHRAMATVGIDVVATAVGDRYVLAALAAGDYSLGGEQSGHIIYRDLATTGDGLLAGLQLLHHVKGSGQRLSELADAVMTTYPQVLLNVRVDKRHPNIAQEMAAEIAAAEAAFDGDGRVLVRPSGTEPLIRVMVEAATSDLARLVAQDLCHVVESRFGTKNASV